MGGLRRARERVRPKGTAIRVGVSRMNPANTPLECGHTIPYGLIYAKGPSREVLQLVAAVGQFNANP